MPATGPVRQSKPGDLGDCRHPQTFLDRTTGDVVYGRCKATTTDLCPSCAEQHRGDGKTIIQAGIAQTHQRQESISLVTLTPPSFWRGDTPDDARRTHRLHKPYWKLIRGSSKPSPKALNAERRRAICGHCTTQRRAEAKASGVPVRNVPPVIHSPEDPLAGLPIDLDAFDYEAAAWWNWNLGDLLHRTFTYLRRHVDADLEYLRVLEASRPGGATRSPLSHRRTLTLRCRIDHRSSQRITTGGPSRLGTCFRCASHSTRRPVGGSPCRRLPRQIPHQTVHTRPGPQRPSQPPRKTPLRKLPASRRRHRPQARTPTSRWQVSRL